jgi:TPR repeat protein
VAAKLPPGGIASVRSKLGQMYANGFGVPKDYTKAYTWFSLASAAGDQRSDREKELLAQKMTEQEIAEGSGRASDWLKKH